jgi:hypothetical protein
VKISQAFPVSFAVNLPPVVIQVFVILSFILMNMSEVYYSRMLLLLAPVSASALSRYSSWLTMRLTAQYQPSGLFLGDMILLALLC